MRHCILVIYGETNALLISSDDLDEETWRQYINTAAIRWDLIDEGAAEPTTPEEATAFDLGLAALICYRHPTITSVPYIEVGPEVAGSSW